MIEIASKKIGSTTWAGLRDRPPPEIVAVYTISEEDFMCITYMFETLKEEMDKIQTESESVTATTTMALHKLDFLIEYDEDSGFQF